MRVFDRELRLPAQDKSVEVRVSAELPKPPKLASVARPAGRESIVRGCARECRHGRQSRSLYGFEDGFGGGSIAICGSLLLAQTRDVPTRTLAP
jgi:hypothetical protein